MTIILSLIFIPGIIFCVYNIIDAYNYIKEGHDYES